MVWEGGVVLYLDSLCRLQFQVSVYCARRIPAHLGCTQCSILLHLIDICFLPCICLWQISQIHTCLRVVVGPGLVSTSPPFYEDQCQTSSGSAYPACPRNGKSGPNCWLQEGSTHFSQRFARRCGLEAVLFNSSNHQDV